MSSLAAIECIYNADSTSRTDDGDGLDRNHKLGPARRVRPTAMLDEVVTPRQRMHITPHVWNASRGGQDQQLGCPGSLFESACPAVRISRPQATQWCG